MSLAWVLRNQLTTFPSPNRLPIEVSEVSGRLSLGKYGHPARQPAFQLGTGKAQRSRKPSSHASRLLCAWAACWRSSSFPCPSRCRLRDSCPSHLAFHTSTSEGHLRPRLLRVRDDPLRRGRYSCCLLHAWNERPRRVKSRSDAREIEARAS